MAKTKQTLLEAQRAYVQALSTRLPIARAPWAQHEDDDSDKDPNYVADHSSTDDSETNHSEILSLRSEPLDNTSTQADDRRTHQERSQSANPSPRKHIRKQRRPIGKHGKRYMITLARADTYYYVRQKGYPDPISGQMYNC